VNAVPPFPRVSVKLRADTSAEVTVQGVRYAIAATGHAETSRKAALDVVTQRVATVLRRAVRVTAHDEQGTWSLVVHPDGRVEGEGQQR
jgi:hypothetical protein